MFISQQQNTLVK